LGVEAGTGALGLPGRPPGATRAYTWTDLVPQAPVNDGLSMWMMNLFSCPPRLALGKHRPSGAKVERASNCSTVHFLPSHFHVLFFVRISRIIMFDGFVIGFNFRCFSCLFACASCLTLSYLSGALKLLVRRQEWHLVCKKYSFSSQQRFSFGSLRGPDLTWSDLQKTCRLNRKQK